MNNEELITYALVAVVALGLGYGAAMLLAPQPVTNTTGTNVTGVQSNVTANATQIAKLESALEGLIYLQSGTQSQLVYQGMSDKGQYVELNFTDDTGRAFPGIAVSKDFMYLYQGATSIDDFAAQVQLAIQDSQEPEPVVQNLTKSDNPKVELFVMSYCPYGTQMEKAILPVQKLLGAKANITIKFVSYVMHGAKETQENARQYCIDQKYPDKFWGYMECFLADGNYSGCMANYSISESEIDSCMNQTYSTFGISDSGTAFPIFQAENDLYGVRGSPTLVINGVQSSVSRSPEAVKQAICAAFITPPAECSTALSTDSASPGFGFAAGSGGSTASCG